MEKFATLKFDDGAVAASNSQQLLYWQYTKSVQHLYGMNRFEYRGLEGSKRFTNNLRSR